MNDVICPFDSKPCDPYCRYRYKDQPGGCYLTTAEELGFQTLVIVETAGECRGVEETYKAVSGNAFPGGNKTQSGIYEKGD